MKISNTIYKTFSYHNFWFLARLKLHFRKTLLFGPFAGAIFQWLTWSGILLLYCWHHLMLYILLSGREVDSVLYLICPQNDKTTNQKIIVFILLSIYKM